MDEREEEKNILSNGDPLIYKSIRDGDLGTYLSVVIPRLKK